MYGRFNWVIYARCVDTLSPYLEGPDENSRKTKIREKGKKNIPSLKLGRRFVTAVTLLQTYRGGGVIRLGGGKADAEGKFRAGSPPIRDRKTERDR